MVLKFYVNGLKVDHQAEQFTTDELLIVPIEDLVDRVYDDLFIEPIILYRDNAKSSEPIEQNHYSAEKKAYTFRGFGYELLVPFSGAQGLFRHAPEVHDENPPYALVDEDGVSIRIVADVGGDLVGEEFTKQLDSIERYIGFQAPQLAEYNGSIRERARAIIEDRKTRLLEAKNIAASFGFPMRRRDGAPATYLTPKVRRKIRPPPPVLPSTAGFSPEPTIAEEEYQNILRIIENMTFVMERNPNVFSRASEETIRDHYLVQLNGQYEGGATGETFNAQGKTDILVRDGSANLFVAECKIWSARKIFPRN